LKAGIDFERWQDEYKRMKFPVDRKSLRPNDFQKVEAANNASRKRYDMAVEGTRREDRATAVAQASAAEVRAREEGNRLADTRLLAPMAGNIAMWRVDPGQTVSAGVPVFSIVDLNPAKVRVEFRKPKATT
jgi:multidrug resistance efflux pump